MTTAMETSKEWKMSKMLEAQDGSAVAEPKAKKGKKDKKDKSSKKNKANDAVDGQAVVVGQSTAQGFDAELDAMFSASASAPAPLPKAVAPLKVDKKRKATAHQSLPPAKKAVLSMDKVGSDDDDAMERSYADRSAQVASGSTKAVKGKKSAHHSDGNEVEEEDDEENDDVQEEEEIQLSDSEAENSPADAAYIPPVHVSLLPTTTKGKGKPPKESIEPRHIQDKRSVFVGNIPIEAVKSRSLTKALKRHLQSLSPYPHLTSLASIRYRSIPFAKPTDDFGPDDAETKDRAAKRRERTALYREAQATAEGTQEQDKGKVYLNAKQKRKVAFIKRDVNEQADSVNAYLTLVEPTDAMRARAKSHADASEHTNIDALAGPLLASLLAAAADGTVFSTRHLRVDLVTPLQPADLMSLQHIAASSKDGKKLPIAGQDHKRTIFVGNLDFAASEEELRDFFERLMIVERGPPPISAFTVVGEETEDASEGDEGDEAASPLANAAREGEWVRSVRIVRDSATQLGKGFAYVKFVDEACVDEVMAIHEAEEAFLSTGKPGGASKRPTGAAAPSGSDGANGDFRRKLKFKKRALRVGRCKAQSASMRGGAKGSTASGLATPARQQRGRSSGAPTPGGSSPYVRADRGRKGADGGSDTRSPSSTTRTKQRPNAAAAGAPAIRRSAAETAATALALSSLSKTERSALKKADEARQARRAEKKARKTASLKVGREAAGKKKDKDGGRVRVGKGKKEGPGKNLGKKVKGRAPVKGKGEPGGVKKVKKAKPSEV